MKVSEATLRSLIRTTLNENCGPGDHRTVNGDVVPFGCPECVDDIHTRLEDASWHRDRLSRGSADRSHFNGLLAALRRALRAALKELDRAQLEDEQSQESEVVLEIEPLE